MDSTSKQRKPRSRGRKLLRLLLWLCLIPVVAVSVVQVILWTDIPRRTVVARLERTLDAHVEVGALDVGWFGRSTVRDLAIRLPLDDEAFLRAPRVDIRHTALPRLLVGGGLSIDAVRLEAPQIRLVQNDHGVWNVFEAAARPSGSGEPATASPLRLPRLEISGADVVIAPSGRPPVTWSGGRLTGAADGALAWTFTGQLQDLLWFDGRLALDTTLAQEVAFRGEGLQRLLAAFGLTDVTDDIDVRATWSGSRTDSGIEGHLAVAQARVGAAKMTGTLTLQLDNEGMRLGPLDLIVDDPERDVSRVHLSDGEITWTGARFEARRVAVELAGIRSVIDGHWSPRDGRGAAAVSWDAAYAPWDVDARGRLDLEIDDPAAGPLRIAGTASAAGQRRDAGFKIDVALDATGPDWQTLAGRVTINEARWRDPDRTIELPVLRTTLAAQWPAIRLIAIGGPGFTASMRGAYDAHSGDWSIAGTIDDYPIVVADVSMAASATIDARGDHDGVDVETLTLSTPRGTTRVSGRVGLGAAGTLDAKVDVTALIDAPADDATADDATAARVHVRGRAEGTIAPRAVRFSGTARTPEFMLDTVPLPALTMPLDLTIDEENDVRWSTGTAALFGGTFRTEGAFAFADGAAPTIDIDFVAHDVSLARLGALAPAARDLDGTASARGSIELPMTISPAFRVAADWEVADVTWRGAALGAGRGRVRASPERVDVDDFEFGQGGGRLTGRATIDPATRMMTASVTAREWSVAIGTDAKADVNAKVDAEIDLQTGEARGSAEGSMGVSLFGEPFATVDAEATLSGRSVAVSAMTARVCDGLVEGHGVVPIDDWTNTRAEVSWSGLRLSRMGAGVPGRVSGHAVLEPASEPHPLEPLVVRGRCEPDGVRLGLTDVGAGDFVIYAGRDRAILTRSTVEFAGGAIEGWARATWRNGNPLVFVDARLQGLQAAALAGMLNETPTDMPGRIDGTLTGGGPLNDVDRLFGQAVLTIAESDLLEVDVVSALYAVMNLNIGSTEPQGRGRIELRLEGRSVDVTHVEYFNHGADIVGRGRIEDLWMGEASVVNGTAVGAVRPLKDLDLPVFRNIDRGMRALQTNTGGVRLGGTLGEPNITPVPLPELGAALRAAMGR